MRAEGLVHPAATVLVVATGAALLATGRPDMAAGVWLAGLVVTGAPVVLRSIVAARHGRFATDLVAMIAIVAALLLRQPVAGLVIVLMQTGGETLERYAGGRASAAVSALEAAAPRIAHRCDADATVEVPVAQVAVGDVLLVRPGELVPTDGVVIDGDSELDTSPLTGEAIPRAAVTGAPVLSGMVNGNGTFRMRATARSDHSQYAAIVELVRSAQASKAPFQRMADRWAVWFTPFTLVVCGLTFAFTHDWTRVLAVLVVATPCPLLLAAPTAIVGGINRLARARVIVRNGGALERLSHVTAMVFDKTGTLTVGKPSIARIRALAPHSDRDVLRLAAAAEQGSSHLIGRVIDEYAREHLGPGASLRAAAFQEEPGRGVRATVEGNTVHVGSRAYVASHATVTDLQVTSLGGVSDALHAWVAVDGTLIGAIEFVDAPRPGVGALLARLRALGVRRVALLSGDHELTVQAAAARLGIADAVGDLLPADKAHAVSRMRTRGDVVAMVGDGTNDAPALSVADVGIALGGHGGGITAQAADVVLLVDDLDRVGDAIAIARRTMHVARQSVGIGLGLSGIAMGVAAFGYLNPIPGALAQEAIDVAVIVNALRAARA